MKQVIAIFIYILFHAPTFAQSEAKHPYTARQCHNLKGQVKTMITSTGDTLRFDKQGELTNRHGKRLLGIEDTYDRAHTVIFPDSNTRYESNMIEEEAGFAKNWYIFDHKGRITKKRLENTYLVSQETNYVYSEESWNKDHPSRAYVEYNEDGIGTYDIIDYYYESTSFDNQGNWIWRGVTTIELEFDGYDTNEQGLPHVEVKQQKEYRETAEYTYY